MPQFIDRRLNPRDKSLGNRMRFLKRSRARIKEAVDKAVRERSIGDAAKGGSDHVYAFAKNTMIQIYGSVVPADGLRQVAKLVFAKL